MRKEHGGVPRLAVLPSLGRGHPAWSAWREDGPELWPAWHALTGWEQQVDDRFGARLGEEILVLWALSRFANDQVPGVLDELIEGNEVRPRFSDPVMEDMVTMAFALGAGWITERDVPTPSPVRVAAPRSRAGTRRRPPVRGRGRRPS